MGGGGGERVLPYMSYHACVAPEDMVFDPFWSEIGYDF